MKMQAITLDPVPDSFEDERGDPAGVHRVERVR
jgi:hypothetical protein